MIYYDDSESGEDYTDSDSEDLYDEDDYYFKRHYPGERPNPYWQLLEHQQQSNGFFSGTSKEQDDKDE